MILIPEVVLLKFFQDVVDTVREEMEDTSILEEQKTLYLLFNGIQDGKNNWYLEAQDIFKRRNSSHQRIEFDQVYDQEWKEGRCSIALTLPGQEQNLRSISNDNSFGNTYNWMEGQGDEDYKPGFASMSTVTHHLVINAKNKLDVQILYHFFYSILIGLAPSMAVNLGLNNLKISGGEVNLDEGLLPGPFYSRAVVLNFIYETKVPLLQKVNRCFNINFTGEFYDSTQEN